MLVESKVFIPSCLCRQGLGTGKNPERIVSIPVLESTQWTGVGRGKNPAWISVLSLTRLDWIAMGLWTAVVRIGSGH